MPLKSYKIFKCLLWYIDVFGLQTECGLELDYFFQIDNEIVLSILVLGSSGDHDHGMNTAETKLSDKLMHLYSIL